MKESQAWREQCKSDLAAASRVLDRSDESTYCQSIAKCQQVVEKAIKMLVAILIDKKLLHSRPVDRGHSLTRHIAVLRRMPNAAGNELPKHVANLLDDFRLSEIVALSLLAPAYPTDGALFNRNTEYPYNANNSFDQWIAPASIGSYTIRDVERFQWLAQDVADKSERFYLAAQTGVGS